MSLSFGFFLDAMKQVVAQEWLDKVGCIIWTFRMYSSLQRQRISLIGLSRVIIFSLLGNAHPGRSKRGLLWSFPWSDFSLPAFMTAHQCCLSNYPEKIESSCSCHILSHCYCPFHILLLPTFIISLTAVTNKLLHWYLCAYGGALVTRIVLFDPFDSISWWVSGSCYKSVFGGSNISENEVAAAIVQLQTS